MSKEPTSDPKRRELTLLGSVADGELKAMADADIRAKMNLRESGKRNV